MIETKCDIHQPTDFDLLDKEELVRRLTLIEGTMSLCCQIEEKNLADKARPAGLRALDRAGLTTFRAVLGIVRGKTAKEIQQSDPVQPPPGELTQ